MNKQNPPSYTNLLVVALFTTRKEYLSGQVHSMMDKYINRTPSNKFSFDWYFVFDQGEESDYKDLLNYKNCNNIKNIFIHSLKIEDKHNAYSREYRKQYITQEYYRLGKPWLGLTCGPNNLFFRGMDYLQLKDYRNLLILETDTLPVKNFWFDDLYKNCQEQDFLVLGSVYKGNHIFSQRTDAISKHLNGVAIYRNSIHLSLVLKRAMNLILSVIRFTSNFIEQNPNLKHFEEDLSRFNLPTNPCLSINYDLAIYYILTSSSNQDIHDNKDLDHFLINSPSFTNVSMDVDKKINTSKVLDKFPDTVILHKKSETLSASSGQPYRVPVFLHVPKNAGTYVMELFMSYFSRVHNESNDSENFFIKRITVESDFYNLTVFVKFLDNKHKADPYIQNHPFAVAANYDHPKARSCDLNTLKEYIKNNHLVVLAINVEPISDNDMRAGLLQAYELLGLCRAIPFNFTILRDSLSRQQSLFYYLTGKESSHEPTHQSISHDTFIDYLNSEDLEDSWLIRVLSGAPHNATLNKHWMDIATKFLESHNFLIGDISRTDYIINRVLNDCYGQPIIGSDKQSSFRNPTKNQNKITVNDLDKKTKQKFLDHTYWDNALYKNFIE